MNGLFVTIDALDGVGKSTLVHGLAEHLHGIAMDTPGPDLRRVADAVLAALGEDQMARCLFYASSVVAQGSKARALADGGALVIMDRYWGSTVAYARARGVAVDLSSIADAVPRPDVSILLTLDEGERVRRLGARGDLTAADDETLDDRFREIVLEQLGSLSNLVVDVTGAGRAEAVLRVARAVAAHVAQAKGRV